MLTILLDIDGVLTTYSWVKQFKKMSDKCPLDPRCVYWLNKLLNEFDINIIMNTSWIMSEDDFNFVRRKFEVDGVNQVPKDTVYHVFKMSGISKTGPVSSYIEEHNIDKNKILIIDDLPFQFDKILPKKSIYIIEDGWDKDGINFHHYKNIKERLEELK